MEQTATSTQPVVVQIQPPTGPMRPLTSAEMSAIRARRNDISNQLTSSMDRREGLIRDLQDAPQSAQPGILAQIQLLDQRILSIEKDMEESGRMLRTGLTDMTTTLAPPPGFNRRSAETDAERAAMISAAVVVPILLAVLVLRLTRGRRRRGQPDMTAQQDARMERIEQAVDAIALEVERVGESQRYQAKLLAEANMMPDMGTSRRAAEPVRAREG